MTNVISHKQKLINLLNNCSESSILDYGCGKGDFIKLLLSKSDLPKLIVAADADPAMIKTISDHFSDSLNHGIVIPKTVLNPSELTDHQFDKIICHNVLECVEDKLGFINSFKPLIRIGACCKMLVTG